MDFEDKAIERLKLGSQVSLAHYEKPLLLTYSGGKNSDVCLKLAQRAGIPLEVCHSLTTADAPPTIHHIKQKFALLEEKGTHCEIIYPTYKGKRTSMWRLIEEKLIPPTRIARYCYEADIKPITAEELREYYQDIKTALAENARLHANLELATQDINFMATGKYKVCNFCVRENCDGNCRFVWDGLEE